MLKVSLPLTGKTTPSGLDAESSAAHSYSRSLAVDSERRIRQQSRGVFFLKLGRDFPRIDILPRIACFSVTKGIIEVAMGLEKRKANEYLWLALAFLPAAVVTWGIHEFAHWFAGTALGYEMWISFNRVGLVSGEYEPAWHANIVSAAGPMITWIQAVLVLLAIRRWNFLWLYSFLYLTVWTRALAMGISFIAHPNDEARISLDLGMPIWLLPAVSVLFTLSLTWLGSRYLKVGWKGQLLAYVMASIVSTIVVMSDQVLFKA